MEVILNNVVVWRIISRWFVHCFQLNLKSLRSISLFSFGRLPRKVSGDDYLSCLVAQWGEITFDWAFLFSCNCVFIRNFFNFLCCSNKYECCKKYFVKMQVLKKTNSSSKNISTHCAVVSTTFSYPSCLVYWWKVVHPAAVKRFLNLE